MNTADQIRLQQWEAYWRVREQQVRIVEGYMIPIAKLLGEKLRELYPELMPLPAPPTNPSE